MRMIRSDCYSRALQCDVNDFRRCVNPQRKPVPDSVGNDELAFAVTIESRPIPEQRGAASQLLIQHQLSAVGMARKRERHLVFGGGIKRVRMMRQQDRERIRRRC